MKFQAFSLFAGVALIASIYGCGGNNNATTAGQCPTGQVATQYGCQVGGAQTGYNNCAAGQVFAANGCYQQAYNCGQNAPAGQAYAWVNNACVLGTVSYGNNNYNNPYGTSNCSAGQVSTQQYGCQTQVNNCGTAAQGQGYAYVQGVGCVLGTISYGNTNPYTNPYGTGGFTYVYYYTPVYGQPNPCPVGGNLEGGFCVIRR